jgi:hypothetical protein
VDKTAYIPKLEQAGTVLVFLRPRRFGKSVIVSMLEYCYDILYKERFHELFGHLEVGKNPTPEANSYLVFRISFASLNTSSVESFEESLNNRIRTQVKIFLSKYKNHPACKGIFDSFTDERIDAERDAINLFIWLAGVIASSRFRNKVRT